MGKDKKKSKYHRKEKKHKKDKKKKKHNSSTSESTSSDEWVEKDDSATKIETKKPSERDEWMSMESIFSGKTRDQLIERKKKDEDKEKQPNLLVEPGQSSRELNPFWKDGGTGLPPEEKATLSSLSSGVGDLGADWLRRALKRAKEQAEEESRSLESVIAERWGSLSEFEKLLNEAESKSRQNSFNERHRDDKYRLSRENNYRQSRDEINHQSRSDGPWQSRENSDRQSRDDNSRQSREDSFRQSRDDNSSRSRQDSYHQSRDNSRQSREDRDNSCHQSRDNSRQSREDRDDSCQQSRVDNSRQSREDSFRQSRDDNSRLSRDDSYRNSRNNSSHGGRSHSSRDDDYRDSKHRESRPESTHLKKLRFKRPDSDSDSDQEAKRYHSSSSRKNWKKPGYEDKGKVSGLASERSAEKDKEPSPEVIESSDEDDKEFKKRLEDDGYIPTPDEMNALYADYLRAHLDEKPELAEKCLAIYYKAEKKVEEAENNMSTGLVDERGRSVRLLTETDNRGFTRPVQGSVGQGSTKKRRTDTHQGKERVRYFADDDKYSLQDMFEKEKYNSQAENDAEFYKLMKKASNDDEDAFDTARMDTQLKDEMRNRQQAIRKMAAKEKVLDNCRWCIGERRASSNNIVLYKNKVYLAVPTFKSLTEGHCLIVPQAHVSCVTMLDEDVWDEVMGLRKQLVQIFGKDNEDVIFFESALYIDRHPHMLLHCVPVPIEIGETAPIYFKKAIMECENEWTNNKKVVELRGRDVRKAVPKGLPYFAVDFGMQSGYAHVIEDKKLFPHNFAQEIIGGMLDLDHSLWRKPKRDTDEDIQKKVESLKQLIQE